MKTIKISILGNSSTGKTCLINRYKNNNFHEFETSTIGVEFTPKKIIIDNEEIKLHIWDLSGQEKFHSITTSYYRSCHGIIITFDITDNDSFKSLNKILMDVYKFSDPNTCIILVGNKCDLFEKRKITYDKAKKFADDMGIDYFETSAKDNINIDNLFLNFSKKCKIVYDENHLNKFDKTINLNKKNNKFKCCS